MGTMKAAVMYAPGDQRFSRSTSARFRTAQRGQVLIRVRAFGLNRSELFTRQGFSPNVKFPRILGIEAVGEVEEAGRRVSQGR
jgi:NADPH:quinone reductase-like Zn-dependent oxidoreductase